MRTIAKIVAALAASILTTGCATLLPPTAAPSGPPVTVRDGTLAGASENGVFAFKGIPYAAPPVGNLRWMPPRPAAAWSGVREARAYGHDCMQAPFPLDAAPLRTEPSEDCLYLNVWRPANGAKNLPVVVWIYGGGFVNGGSSPAIYDGTRFAQNGIVFVSFNYRLGRFGFFGFPALTAADPNGLLGNYGYMDQIAALKWVRANIAAFGGDPNAVTVFGESAGGASVHMLLTSPLARGLFERAVVESGGGRDDLMGTRRLSEDLPGNPSLQTIGVNFARSVGIDGTDAVGLAKLRALPADKIVDGLNMGTMSPKSRPQTYGGPIEDGKLVTRSPQQTYQAGDEASVPIMIGANSADLGFFFPKTKTEAFASFGTEAAQARRAYDPTGAAPLRAVAWEIGMDQMMVEPACFTVREFSAQGLPAYEYRFSYVAPAEAAALDKSGFGAMMGIKGAPHASEIPFVFDTVKAAYGEDTTPADEAMAAKMHAYWVNFARTGNPNGGALPLWPAYDRKADTLMDFTQDGGPVAEKDPWRTRLDVTAAKANKAEAAAARKGKSS